MQIELTGRQTRLSKKLRSLTEEWLAHIEKILGKGARGHVTLTPEKHRHIAEVEVKTRTSRIVALAESTAGMEDALRNALAKAESQAVRYTTRRRAQKRLPKAEKTLDAPPQRVKQARAKGDTSEASRAASTAPVTVHSFPSNVHSTELHIVRSTEAVALRPMTIEEAVKEAEFRDHEVFVFRDNEGNVKVLHRKRDGKMELMEAP